MKALTVWPWASLIMIGARFERWVLFWLAFWGSWYGIGWLCRIVFRYRCPSPVIDDPSVRACIAGGHCSCDNLPPRQHPVRNS